VRTTLAVVRLAGGHGQIFFHQAEIEAQEEGAVKNQRMTFAALGVAGEFQSAERKVRMALKLHGAAQKSGQGVPVPPHNVAIGRSDVLQRVVAIDFEDE